MSKPMQIGITGNIGSGKSFISNLFAKLGIPVYDADTRAKWIMSNDPILKENLISEFGNKVFLENGDLNREHLSSIVFSNKIKLDLLNSIVHPRVAIDYNDWVIANEGAKYVLKEAALLFEAGSYKILDKIITVTAPEQLRLKRVLNRDAQRTESGVRKIMSEQLSEDEKVSRADYVIVNDGQKMLLPQILQIHQKLSEN